MEEGLPRKPVKGAELSKTSCNRQSVELGLCDGIMICFAVDEKNVLMVLIEMYWSPYVSLNMTFLVLDISRNLDFFMLYVALI